MSSKKCVNAEAVSGLSSEISKIGPKSTLALPFSDSVPMCGCKHLQLRVSFRAKARILTS
jgi:hypothetical protein